MPRGEHSATGILLTPRLRAPDRQHRSAISSGFMVTAQQDGIWMGEFAGRFRNRRKVAPAPLMEIWFSVSTFLAGAANFKGALHYETSALSRRPRWNSVSSRLAYSLFSWRRSRDHRSRPRSQAPGIDPHKGNHLASPPVS